MFQVKSLILYLFLFVLNIPLDFNLDTNYKQVRLSKTLTEEGFKFNLSIQNSLVIFNLVLVLLPAKVDFFL